MTDTAVRLEIRHLRLLLAIVDAGGLTRASRNLHLTQSALSHQLRDAEERLGTPLFDRIRKRLVLTDAGECLLPTARLLLAELKRAEAALHPDSCLRRLPEQKRHAQLVRRVEVREAAPVLTPAPAQNAQAETPASASADRMSFTWKPRWNTPVPREPRDDP